MELFTPDIGLIVWMLIPFLVVFFVLAKFAWPAILKGVETRNQYIDESLLAAKQARDELARVQADSRDILNQARKEQAAILAEAAKTRDMIVDNAKGKADEETAKMIASARDRILLEKEEAIRQIRREVASLSVEIAEKVLREKLSTSTEQMNMIDRLLDEVNVH